MAEKKKEKVIAVRIDDKFLGRLDKYCQKFKINKSLLTRIALEKYMRFYQKEEQDPEPLLIWGKLEMIEILKSLKEETIKSIAEIAFETSRETYKNMLEASVNKKKKKLEKVLTPEEEKTIKCKVMMGILKNLVFSAEGFNWFTNIHESWDGVNLKIAGTHNLGLNFSRYIKYRTIKHMEPYDYLLYGENLQENKVILDFKPK
ncbi:MAG: hypothetical protein ACTSR8_06990 [Promethearchaeota archaeon]